MKGFFSGERVIIFLCWIILIISTSLVMGRTYLTGDSLFLDHLYRSFVLGDDSWSSWRLTVSPAFVPDVLLYFLGSTFLPLPVDRIVFVSVAQAILIVLCLIFLVREVCSTVHWPIYVFAILGVSFVSLTASTTSMWMYFNTTNNHIPYLIFGILGTVFLIRALFVAKSKDFVLLGTSILIGVVSAPLFYVTFVPAASACTVFLLAIAYKSGIPKGRAILSLLAVGIGLLAGKMAEPILVPNPLVGGRAGLSSDRAAASLKWYLENERGIWLAGNVKYYLIYSVVILGFLVSIYFLIPKLELWIKEKREFFYHCQVKMKRNYTKRYFLCFFLIVLTGINWVAVIFSGAYLDQFAHRYFMLPGFIAASILLIQFNESLRFQLLLSGKLALMTGSIAAVLCAVWTGVVAAQQLRAGVWTQETRRWGMPSSPSPDEIRCFDATRREYRLHRGVSTFWVARRTTLLSEAGTEILPFLADLSPFLWMNSESHYFPPEKDGAPYDFVVALKGPDQFGLSPEAMAALPFTNSAHIPCGPNYEIVISQDGSLDRLVRWKSFAFLKNGINKVAFPDASFFMNTGTDKGGYRVADGEIHAPGYLMYGPYIPLLSGNYTVEIDYELSDGGDGARPVVDIGRFNKDPIVFYKGVLEPGRRTHVAEFTIDEALPNDGEIRVFFGGEGRLAIYGVRAERR